MARRNIRKIVVGMFLIGLALMSAAVALYFLRLKPDLIIHDTENQPAILDAVKQGVSVIDVTQSYKPAARREGFLWFDKTASKWIITLGFVDGLRRGSTLRVYDRDVSIGTVIVSAAFSGSSHVLPGPDTTLSREYYQVKAEK